MLEIYFQAQYSRSRRTLDISRTEFREIHLNQSFSPEIRQRLSQNEVNWLRKWLQNLDSGKAKVSLSKKYEGG
jgi:hypothetical protein